MCGKLRVTASRNQARCAVFPTLRKKADGILADRLELKKTFNHSRARCGLLEDMLRNLDQRGTSACDEGRGECGVGFICEVKGSRLGIQDSQRTLNDEPVQFRTANALGEGSTYSMQEIENPVFLLLQFLKPPLQPAHPIPAFAHGKKDCGEQQSAECRNENRPHEVLRNQLPESRPANQERLILSRGSALRNFLAQILNHILKANSIPRVGIDQCFMGFKDGDSLLLRP